MKGMCPHCGELFEQTESKVPHHSDFIDGDCPGSQQIWRNPESDGRPLWNGKPNPHYYRNTETWTARSKSVKP